MPDASQFFVAPVVKLLPQACAGDAHPMTGKALPQGCYSTVAVVYSLVCWPKLLSGGHGCCLLPPA
jgi:hypothetical protein